MHVINVYKPFIHTLLPYMYTHTLHYTIIPYTVIDKRVSANMLYSIYYYTAFLLRAMQVSDLNNT